MKFVIDRIEENIAILENLNTKEKLEVSLDSLPNNISDGTILNYQENKYIVDNIEEENRRTSIKDKFNRLKKN